MPTIEFDVPHTGFDLSKVVTEIIVTVCCLPQFRAGGVARSRWTGQLHNSRSWERVFQRPTCT